MKLSIASARRLNNGIDMPVLGLGVFQVRDGRVAKGAVLHALEVGYRHIDTAKVYGNEPSVGQAIRESGVPRSQIFVTTKLWNSDHGYDAAIRAGNNSLKRLGLDYVDLYLVHWPVEKVRLDTWRAMETLLAEGKTRAIGVSNYMVGHLKELLGHCTVVPAVNQIELHPYNYMYREPVVELCRRSGIQVEAYSPLTRGRRLDDPRLVEIAKKYAKTPAQILIRWALGQQTVVIPKSVQPERIRANADVFDFSISDEDMARLNSFNEDLITGWDPTHTP